MAALQQRVGLGVSTSLPDMDFETYSEAGYEWDERANKWRKLNLSGKPGLPATGAPVYAEHISCEVLQLSYNLKDGRGPQLWIPGCPLPQDLFDHLARGGLIEAHNAGFEQHVWQHVCVAKMGWPELPPAQVRCSKAKCRAWSLSGGLDDAAKVLQLSERKNPDGTRLLNKFSKPRNPTKADKRLRLLPQDDPVDGPKLYEYGLQDIVVESALSERVPDLTPQELAVWQLDQKINRRGVHIDLETVDAMIMVYEAECLRLNAELQQITQGYYRPSRTETVNFMSFNEEITVPEQKGIQSAGQVKAIVEFLAELGVHTPSLDADAVDALLKRDLPPVARRILEIRQSVGSSNIKKLYAFRLRTSADSRLRDMFEYYGAATGRWAGRGVQPQNMASAGPDVVRATCCGAIRSAHLPACPYCTIGDPASEPAEWGAEAMESVIRDVKAWTVYDNWPDPVAAMTGCLRGLFTAAPGHTLISSDFSAIEAVVLACMAGEQWRIDVFKTHGKIYEMSASKISGVPFDEFMRHKKDTGQHHPLRKTVGKVAELACFTRYTQVLTGTGYKSIVDITADDLLWDGAQWVKSSGVVHKGKRNVINLDGVQMTPDHPITTGNSWKEARQLVSNKSTLRLALAFASANLPLSIPAGKKAGLKSKCSVIAAQKVTRLNGATSGPVRQRAVTLAQKLKALKQSTSNTTGSMRTPSQTKSTAGGCLTGYPQLLVDALGQTISSTRTMGAVGLKCVTCGSKTKRLFCGTSSPLKAGTTQNLRWTERTLTETTNRATFVSSPSQKTRLIKGRFKKCSLGSTNSKDVYDIVNAGPLNRFTIKTESGHLIVHNSGYAGWIGAWKAFGADAFMSEPEIKAAILRWRAESPRIVEFWGGQWYQPNPEKWHFEPLLFGLEGAAVSAVMQPGGWFKAGPTLWGVVDDALYCQLPSGRFLTYHRPRLDQTTDQRGLLIWQLSYEGYNSDSSKGPVGWMRRSTYGGKLCENVVQAVARDILANSLLNLEAAGYHIVMHIHDEVVAEVPDGFGSIEELERIMATMPAWCVDWPIKAAGGWQGLRYRKE